MSDIIYTLSCPDCNTPFPQALKKKKDINLLETIEVNCPDEKCKWKSLAKNAVVKEMTMEEWLGPNYSKTAPGFMSAEQFKEIYENELHSGKVSLDEILKNK